MKLAAFYIPQGHLPNIFGDDHEEVTINLGGENLYKFQSGQLTTINPNPFYIEDILSKDISLFSCIVGNNGGGKTTLIGAFGNAYYCKYVVEFEGGTYEIRDHIEDVHRIYYSPYLHHKTFSSVRNNFKDLSKFAMVINDNHGDGGHLAEFLQRHHSESIKRWISFNHFYSQEKFSKISLPVFHEVEVKLNHFDANIHKPETFNDTSYQLRKAIGMLFNKMKSESEEKEIDAGRGKNLREDQATRISFLIRFEYAVYDTFLGKLISILEQAGNKFLSEGFIDEDYEEQIGERDVRNGLLWLLENSGVRRGEDIYNFSRHIIGIELIDYILSITDSESATDNWRIITIPEEQVLKLIQLFDEFNQSFINDWFEYEKTPMFTFIPKVVASSGEQSFLNLFSTLYYHAQNIKNKVDVDFHSFDSLGMINDKIMLLIDEGDNAFHPQWKKEFVRILRKLVPKIFKGYKIQIIITSHDPLTLSDFPKNNVVFLDRSSGVTQIGNSSEKRTFGGNISDLLKDSFFINDGQIGGFASDMIDWLIDGIRKKNLSPSQIERMERFINCIDEPILKFKLAEMLSESLGESYFERKLLDEEIARLNERRERL